MTANRQPKIYTIGHSTHSLENFIGMLRSFGVKHLADIRRFPGSRKYPHFNREVLEESLSEHSIDYSHIEKLGGRRPAQKNSINNRWRNASFRGYADYMETEDFKNGMDGLLSLAKNETLAYMCSEAVWWRCHRSMVSDYLKAKGWKVEHIMAAGKAEEHPYNSAARVVNGKVFYSDEGQLFL